MILQCHESIAHFTGNELRRLLDNKEIAAIQNSAYWVEAATQQRLSKTKDAIP